jgi:putative transcriptional regulator
MAIHIDLDRVLLDKDITLAKLAERIGNALPNLSILKTNMARAVRFSILSALCRELGFQPGDLLEYRQE